MNIINYDFKNTTGTIKCLNAVNNGPVAPGVRDSYTNFYTFKDAGISYARNHDASLFVPYGGEHIVDVHRIFKNFDADENDPASYVFEPTDKYLLNTVNAGTKVFYRLGAAIEHRYKFGTYPPKDYAKWARICEHIIMHYTRGWADGFNWDIEYWEIWNEPDMYNADGSNPCWQGTIEEFNKLYITAAKHLKSRFPQLKIGGPAFCTAWVNEYKTKFFEDIKSAGAPLDFYSYHCYKNNVEYFAESMQIARDTLKQYGYENAEIILNEWNYVRGWSGADWKYTLKAEKSQKGASFIAAVMSTAQKNAIDMLMYYDARPCAMNGMFENETYRPLKGYYPFVMAKKIMDLKGYVPCNDAENIHSIASSDGKNAALMLTYYNDDDTMDDTGIKLCLKNLGSHEKKIRIYILDDENDMRLLREENSCTESMELYLEARIYDVFFIEIE